MVRSVGVFTERSGPRYPCRRCAGQTRGPPTPWPSTSGGGNRFLPQTTEEKRKEGIGATWGPPVSYYPFVHPHSEK
ncbi:hypothetical protein HPB50_008511 [Hyalomma asiaticum]|uniref:Uncharacterized protein n=1 Tax=Hyalomma asiaticum TaxID=266040 RepID=A0ACB7T428_HYAAI|nr:hypothetical protein HPB50_008511 [Hyalomma asiaticum]